MVRIKARLLFTVLLLGVESNALFDGIRSMPTKQPAMIWEAVSGAERY
jgi:hypothetical protein